MARPDNFPVSPERPRLIGVEIYLALLILSGALGAVIWTDFPDAGLLRFAPILGFVMGTAWLFWQISSRSKAEAIFVPPPSRAVRFFPSSGTDKWTFENRVHALKLEGPKFEIPSLEVPKLKYSHTDIPLDAMVDGFVCATSFQAATAAAYPMFETLGRLSKDFGYAVSLDPESAGHLSEAAQRGYENFLEGHIGETMAAEALQSLGHKVEFAETANQSGWDILVDGEPYNVKVGDTASHLIREHFDKHEDIGVITHVDAAADFPTDDVIGLKVLAADNVDHVVHTAEHLDTASGLAEAAFHFPIATFLFACRKEYLISKNHGIDVVESLKSIVYKSAMVAGGSTAGVLIAMANGWNPVGPVIAAGLLARWGWKLFQTAKAQQQLKRLQTYFESWHPVWDSTFESFSNSLDKMAKNQQESFEHEVAAFTNYASEKSSDLQKRLFEALKSLCHASIDLFQRLDDALVSDYNRLQRQVPHRSTLHRTVWPKHSDYIGDLSRRWIDAKRQELNVESEVAQKIFADAEMRGVDWSPKN